MAEAVLRIFPCTKEEFPEADNLSIWLITALKARGGKYLLRSIKGVGLGHNPPGSIVLFRHGDKIIGEAVVEEDVVSQYIKEGHITYEGFVKFAPSSIRIYIGFLPIETLANLTGGKEFPHANPYYKINDWSIYPKILAEVIKEGFY